MDGFLFQILDQSIGRNNLFLLDALFVADCLGEWIQQNSTGIMHIEDCLPCYHSHCEGLFSYCPALKLYLHPLARLLLLNFRRI